MHVILSDRREGRISACAKQAVSHIVAEILRLRFAALRLRMTGYIIFIVKRY
jgi:hypothetical protein